MKTCLIAFEGSFSDWDPCKGSRNWKEKCHAIAFLNEEGRIAFVLRRYYDELRFFVPRDEMNGRILYDTSGIGFDQSFPLPQNGKFEIMEELDIPHEQLQMLSQYLELRQKLVPLVKRELSKKLPR